VRRGRSCSAVAFGEPIFKYSYRDAVIEGHLIDHEPPVRIETALARAGIVFKKGEQLDLLNTRTGEVGMAHAPDEIRFEVDQFNKQAVTPEFNRVVADELAEQIEKTAALLSSQIRSRDRCGDHPLLREPGGKEGRAHHLALTSLPVVPSIPNL